MKEIKVLTSACNCSQKFYELVVKVAQTYGIDAHITKVDDIMEVMQYNTMTLPALVIDGKLVARGTKTEKELLEILK